MTDIETTYAVVGGGIAGASVAYHLSERTDESVTVFERREPGGETTAKSMAMYGLYGDATQYRMKRYGLRLYNEFFSTPSARPTYDFAGMLVAATTDEGARNLQNSIEGEPGARSLSGVDRDLLEYVPGEELDEVMLLPRVNTDAITGAAFRPRVGYMDPRELAREFVARARENGVRFETDTRVRDVTVADGTVSGLVTDTGRVDAEEVVCAAGPWTVRLARRAGVDLPVRHTRAPILKLRPDERAAYSLPTISHHESSYAVYRQRARDPGAMYLGYNPAERLDDVDAFLETYDEFDPDAVTEGAVPDAVREGMWETADQFVPTLRDAEAVDEWVGVRSVTPDGNPVVGWTAREGFSVAAFHSSGIQLAPKVGDVIARQLVDGDPTPFYDALSPARFEGYTDVHDGSP